MSAAYHAKTQFSGSQDGIVFFAVLLPLRANKEAGLSLVFFGGRERRKRCGSPSGKLSNVPSEQEAADLSA